jgi:Flp pilus assembly protein TadD
MWLRTSLALALVTIIAAAGCKAGESSKYRIKNAQEYTTALKEATDLAREPLATYSRLAAISPEDQNRLIVAKERYEALVEYQPTLFTLHVALGAVRHALGDLMAAESSFSQALSLAPPNPSPDAALLMADTHHGLASIYLIQNRYQEAEAHAKQALAYRENDPNLLCTLAAIELQLKEVDRSRRHIEQALKLDPSHQRARDLMKLLGSEQASK